MSGGQGAKDRTHGAGVEAAQFQRQGDQFIVAGRHLVEHHALEASGGKTYAELDKDDPVRATMMNASFLRASLFTSVVSFGVAYASIAWLLKFVSSNKITAFVWYRVALGAALVALLGAGAISAT